jgi:hypothetical protein
MGFQIKNKEGEALTIKELDKEAAEFWNKKIHDKYYANPSPEGTSVFKQQTNWFDVIGYNIHSPEVNYTKGWDNVKCSLWTLHIQGLYNKSDEDLNIHIQVTKEFNKPYYDLIDYWESKGYVPVKCD